MEDGLCQCGCGQKTIISSQTNTKRGWIKGAHRRFLQGHHARINPPKYNGGKKTKGIYTLIAMPGHHRADSCGYVREHVLIAEKVLGKILPPKAVVHHHSSIQLVICQDQGYHRTLHRRTNAYNSCGHANWRLCRFCKAYDDTINMAEYNRKGDRLGEFRYQHNKCAAEYEARRRKEVPYDR
jgi:hypothetical protein